MEDTVVWYKSARVWSAVVTLVSLGLSLSGVVPMITPDQVNAYVNIILLVIATISAGGVGIGQAVSNKKITLSSTANSVTVSVAGDQESTK